MRDTGAQEPLCITCLTASCAHAIWPSPFVRQQLIKFFGVPTSRDVGEEPKEAVGQFVVDPRNNVTAFCILVTAGVLRHRGRSRLNPASLDAEVIWNTFDRFLFPPHHHGGDTPASQLRQAHGPRPQRTCVQWTIRMLPPLPAWLRRPLQVTLV